jgi:hypothetical protein
LKGLWTGYARIAPKTTIGRGAIRQRGCIRADGTTSRHKSTDITQTERKMESEQFTKLPMTSSLNSGHSTTLDHATFALERAKILFGCYRRGEANDPDQYVAAIAAVLSLYPVDIIRKSTDPRTGISTDEKFASFMPNSGELKIYCDRLMRPIIEEEHRARITRQVREMDDQPAQRRLTYAELKEKYGDWNLRDGKTAEQIREEARSSLIGKIGQEAFDALPDAPA